MNNWDQLRARTAVVDAIVNRAREGAPTATVWAGVPGVWDHFDDESHLLRELQGRWFRSLATSVDNALETGDGELLDDVRRAYSSAAARHHGLRRILDQHAAHPALAPLVRREHALLARAAGVTHGSEVAKVIVTLPEQRRGFFSRMFKAA